MIKRKNDFPTYKLVLGTLLNPLSDVKCEIFPRGAMLLKKIKKASGHPQYEIIHMGKHSTTLYKRKIPWDKVQVLDFGDDLIMPGLYDLHFHWVQDKVRLKGKASLLSWLKKYAWPNEAKFKNKTYARKMARRFFSQLSGFGTIGGGCYSSIHSHALTQAMKEVRGHFVIGNVLMTMNSPKYLGQSKKEAQKILQELASRYRSRYAITPRFAPTTHPEVMLFGAKLAKKYHCFIQTHLAETKEEIEYVLSIFKKFPEFKEVDSYTDIYKKVGLLGKRTIMGHGIYLSPSELKDLAKTQTAVAHCPSSNAPVKEGGLGSGLCDFRALEKYKVPWALGSDIGAGPSLSMFDVMRSFVAQQRKKQRWSATYIKALYRSTYASAKILGLSKKHGNLSSGKFADFIVVRPPKKSLGKSAEKVLQSLIEEKQKKRKEYEFLVKHTYLAGVEI